jgi:O-antigen/teichoic acid export membrane protein
MSNLQSENCDSFKKRYFYKLFSNFIGFILNLFSQAIIPRGLGPEAYGNYNFLTNFFTQVVGFFDAGTSTCFYTKLSHRPREAGLVSFYFLFSVMVSFVAIVLVLMSIVTTVYSKIWPGQEITFIYLAIGLSLLMWFAQTINQMTDAYGITVSAELLKIFQKLIGTFILLGLFIFKGLSLRTLFVYNYLLWILFSILLLVLIIKKGCLITEKCKLSFNKFKEYIDEFWKYSHPLFTYSLVVVITGIFDRWFLQVYSGSAQQGFYSLAYQIGAICFLFTGAMAPLFMRELSIAHGDNDVTKIREMFRRYVPLFYTITAYFSCFIAVEAKRVVYIFGGTSFNGATIALAIMAFYPIHQTYGQLNASVFYATAQTKLYRNIGIIFNLVGLPATYFLIAPHDKLGMNAGAIGLAAKMVILNIIGVNVQLYFNSKRLRFNYWNYLRHQIVAVGILFALAISADFVATYLLRLSGNVIVFIVSGVIYSASAAVVVYKLPIILGMRREDIVSFIGECKERLGFSAKG